MQCVIYFVWLLFKVHHVLAWLDSISFLDAPHFVYHQLMAIGLFPLWAIVNNAIMYSWVQVTVWSYIFNYFGFILRSGIPRSYSNSVFHLLSGCQTFFHSGCTIYIPISNAWVFHFLNIPAKMYYCLSFFTVAIIMDMK